MSGVQNGIYLFTGEDFMVDDFAVSNGASYYVVWKYDRKGKVYALIANMKCPWYNCSSTYSSINEFERNWKLS